MNDDSQAIFTKLRAIAEKRIAGCKDCGGSGCSASDKGDHFCSTCQLPEDPTCNLYKPCPTCAKDRAMLKELKEALFPHTTYEPDIPDLTTAMEGSRLLIVDLMDRAGMWEGFVEWHRDEIASIDSQTESHILTDYPLNDWIFNMCVQASAEILTDGEYLVIAIRGYLEGKV